MKDVYNFLKAANTYYLATIDGGIPRVRPFGTVNIYNDKLYIQTGKNKDVSKQISSNPNISISCMNDGKWLRINATLVSDDNYDAKVSMLDAYPSLKGMYSADDDNTEVLYLKDAIATIESFASEKIVIEF